ncbi:methyl-accepting chemotaxis protein [Roseibium algae]|uniref:Methyl-accepting chemotaxis protein n=1 Tax=Roseibium algae TaxID=3123038 RepID=A0ABU8TIW0_9HYPH
MFKKSSVAVKCAASFALLAAFGSITSAVVYTNSVNLHKVVLETARLHEIQLSAAQLTEELSAQIVEFKEFTMTGEPSVRKSAQARNQAIETELANLQKHRDQQLADVLDLAGQVEASWRAWLSGPIAVQMGYMRDIQTVQLARGLEIFGPGRDAVEKIRTAMTSLGMATDTKLAALRDQQHAMASQMTSASLIGGGWIVFLAILLGYVSFRVIARPLGELNEITEKLTKGDLTVDIQHTDRFDEIGRMHRALRIFRESLRQTEALQREAEEQREIGETKRREALQKVAAEFEVSVMAINNEIFASTDQLSGTSALLDDIATKTQSRASGVLDSSNQAASYTQTVATATEELTASIREVNTQIQTTSTLATDAAEEVRKTNSEVAALGEVVQRISGVTSIITDIAEQTNLLALNATIEAARAGDAGRGFSVVATEVKALAEQTAKATEQIEREIAEMKNAATRSLDATSAVSGLVGTIAERTSAMAAAAEEQNAATQEIARNVSQSATVTKNVTEEIGQVHDDSHETGKLSAEMNTAVKALLNRSESLRGSMTVFLNEIKAA